MAVVEAPGVLGNDRIPALFVNVEFLSPLPVGFEDTGNGGFNYTPASGETELNVDYQFHTPQDTSNVATGTVTNLMP